MKNTLKPYDEYRVVNALWLNEIPFHWNCEKLGMRFRERRIKVSDKDFAPLSVTKNGIVPQLATAAKTNDGDNRKLVKIGDFVINSRSDRKGSSGLSIYEGSVSLINTVLKPVDISPKYTHYLLKSYGFIEEFYRNGRGIVADLWTTRYCDMRNINIPLPSQSEQDHIAKYLDWKLSKINKFIKSKKKQIELLKEQKEVIINQAVTKGLNPNVKMKSSGIEWLGDIPETWDICKLRNLGTFKSGTNLTSLEIDNQGPFPVYGGNGLRGYYNNYSHTGVYLLIGRQGALCGNVHLVSGAFWATDHAVVVTVKDNIDIKWAEYMLKVMNLNQYSLSAAQPGLSVERITNISTILPNVTDQIKIANYIESKVKPINKAIEKISKEIELITEYRTTLISDVVIGKVDVRNVTIENYPDEDIDLEEIDDESDDEIMDEEELDIEEV